MIRRLTAFAVLTFAVLLALAAPAAAHVEIEPVEAVAGSVTELTFTVEYEGAATTGLVVQLPAGAAVSEVPYKAGWTSSVDEVERTVSWSGGSSAADEQFGVVVQVPTTTGEVLFPAIQQTTDGEIAWIEQEQSETGNPSPRLTLTADPSATTTTEATAATTTTTSTSTTTNGLPATTLEADQRDDGTTSAAPWLIGSGVAAVVAVAVGGLFLKRKQDREQERDRQRDQGQDQEQ